MPKKKRKNLNKRVLRFESLESRELLAITFSGNDWSYTLDDLLKAVDSTATYNEPSASEQEFLEWVNLLRSNPSATADKIIDKIDPEQDRVKDNGYSNSEFFDAVDPRINAICFGTYPAVSKEDLSDFLKAWNSMKESEGADPLAFGLASLVASDYAKNLSAGSNTYIAHNPDLAADLAKYYGTLSSYNENVFAGSGTAAYNNITYTDASYAFSAFLIDWGESNKNHEHRDVMLSSNYTEMGAALYASSGATYTVADFVDNSSSEGAWLIGVIYSDNNGNSFYNSGEGVKLTAGSLSVSNLIDGEVSDTRTFNSFSSGGYQIYLKNGLYSITVNSPNQSLTRIVNIGGKNVKEDFILNSIGSAAPVIDTNVLTPYQYCEKQEAMPILSSLSITTENKSEYLYQAKISFASRPDNSSESLYLSSSLENGFSTITNTTDGFLLVYGKGSLEDYQKYLRSLTYANSAETATLGERAITVEVFDGVHWSNKASITVNVLPKKVGLTVSNAKIFEGDAGQQYMVFTATLGEASRGDVSFSYSVNGGTAVGGDSADDSDYDNTSSTGTITIAAGKTSAEFQIAVFGNFRLQKEEGTPYSDEFNPYFLVELSDLIGVNLNSEEIRGTIIDDDTPLFWKTEDSWTSADPALFRTDIGIRRLTYAYKPTSSGLAAWSVESDVPAGFSLAVYRNSVQPGNLITNSTLINTETGREIRWAVDAGSWYLVRIEKTGESTEIHNQKVQLTAISSGNAVNIDPFWEELPEEERKVQFGVNNGQLQFALGENIWHLAQRSYTFSSKYEVPLYFSGMSGTFSGSSFTYGEGDAATSVEFDLGGSGISLHGSNSGENMVFQGTEGNDKLVYENAGGTFTANYDDSKLSKTWYFNDITLVKVDSSAGEDVAEIIDSNMDDTVALVENDVAIYGKGHTLRAVNFNTVHIRFLYGGKNSVEILNKEVDTEIYLLTDSLQMLGTVKNEMSLDFSYSVQYFDRLLIKPEEYLNELHVFGSDNTSTVYNTSFGWLTYKNDLIGTVGEAYRVQNIIFRGLQSPEKENLQIILSSDCDIFSDDEYQTSVEVSRTVDNQELSLSLPYVWKDYLEKNKPVSSEIPSLLPNEEPADPVKEESIPEDPLGGIAEADLPVHSTIPESTTNPAEFSPDLFLLEDDLDFSWIQSSWDNSTKKKKSFIDL
ncbi:MAG: hypothetical protein Q4G69_01490 [Planctomycetia bacterium]|nr:hypothetical protein [Planctomycetia bacterium]